MIAAYNHNRPLTEDEETAIPLLQIQSATRFWLSRMLAAFENKDAGTNITVKDPKEMKQLLLQLIDYTEQ